MLRPILPEESFQRLRQIGNHSSRIAADELHSAGMKDPEGEPNNTLGGIVFHLGGNNRIIRWNNYWSLTGPSVPEIWKRLTNLGISKIGTFELQGHEIVALAQNHLRELVSVVTQFGLPAYQPALIPVTIDSDKEETDWFIQ